MFLKQDLFSVHGSCQTLACVAGYSSCGETCFMREHSLNTCSVQAPEKCRFCRLESGQAENVTSVGQDVRHSRRYVIRSHIFQLKILAMALEASWPHPAKLESCNAISNRPERRTVSPRTTPRSDRIFWRPSARRTSNDSLAQPGCFLSAGTTDNGSTFAVILHS